MSAEGGSADRKAIGRRTRAAIEAYVEAWRTGDRDALLAVFAEDAIWEDPVGTPPWRGREGVGRFWDQAHGGGATLTPKVQRVIVCGHEGMLLFRMIVRTAEGGGMGIDVCDHMQVDDAGRITVARAYWDQQCIVPLAEC